MVRTYSYTNANRSSNRTNRLCKQQYCFINSLVLCTLCQRSPHPFKHILYQPYNIDKISLCKNKYRYIRPQFARPSLSTPAQEAVQTVGPRTFLGLPSYVGNPITIATTRVPKIQDSIRKQAASLFVKVPPHQILWLSLWVHVPT